MQSIHRIVALATALTLLAATGAHAGTVLADWTFETSAPSITGASSGTYSPEIGAGSASGRHAGAGTVYSSPAGNGSVHSFSSNTWAVGDYYQFSVSTLGFTGISISWDQGSSNTGPKDFQLQYSTDGTTFTNFASYTVVANAPPNATWTTSGTPLALYAQSDDLSSVAALNNQTTVYFRMALADLTPAGAGATFGTAGTDRVDNVVISGVAAVPLPASAWLFGSGLAGLAFARRRRSRC